MKRGMSYKDAGVDQSLGDDVSEIMASACNLTRGFIREGFGYICVRDDGKPYYSNPDLKHVQLGADTDGVGTKIEIAERMNDHRTVFHDLIAMLVDDASRYGRIPVFATNILDWNHPNQRIARQLAEGLYNACQLAEIAMISGENAELGNRIEGYGKHCYNLGGTVVWLKLGNDINGSKVKAGDTVVAYREKGFRSNGFTLVRKLAERYLGEDWHKKRFDRRSWGRVILEPSTIYTPAWLDAAGVDDEKNSGKAKFISHITGGSFPGKFAEPLWKMAGYGADLEDLWEPCDAMLELQEIGKSGGDQVSDREAYKAWNMGNGGLLVTDDPDWVIEKAKERGIEAKECGKIRSNSGVTIVSKGRWSPGKEIEF